MNLTIPSAVFRICICVPQEDFILGEKTSVCPSNFFFWGGRRGSDPELKDFPWIITCKYKNYYREKEKKERSSFCVSHEWDYGLGAWRPWQLRWSRFPWTRPRPGSNSSTAHRWDAILLENSFRNSQNTKLPYSFLYYIFCIYQKI